MKKLVRSYNILLEIILIFISVCWASGINKIDIIRTGLNALVMSFIILTIIVSYFSNVKQSVYKHYETIFLIVLIVTIAKMISDNGLDFSYIVSMITIILLPLCQIIINNVRVSDRVYGFITIVVGLLSLLNLGNEIYIREVSYILIPCSFILIFNEKNQFIKILYLVSNTILINQLIGKIHITIFFVLIEIAISVNDEDEEKHSIEITYLLIYLLSIVMIILKYIEPLVPITLLIATIANRGFVKNKPSLIFTSKELSNDDIGKSLINLLNRIDNDKYEITLILENKNKELVGYLNKEILIKKVKYYKDKPNFWIKIYNLYKKSIYSLLYYNIYDFSCCYDINSEIGYTIAEISSTNSAIYVHNNYNTIYKDMKETKKMNNFHKIIFISNESRNNYVELFKEQESKTLVINNFVDVDRIIEKSKEKIELEKPKKKSLLVYVGNLDEESKKISRIINIANEIEKVNVWIIGSGKDQAKYEKLIEKNKLESKVKLLGDIINPYNYMEKADYIILTSDYEDFPLIYLESMVLNKEIITTIPTSDQNIDIRQRAYIITKNKYIEEVREIISKTTRKSTDINLKSIQAKMIRELYKLFDGEI